jgi:hypothetical protein
MTPFEKKLKKQVIDLMKSKRQFEKIDEILIHELIDWCIISQKSKASAKRDPKDWQALTTVAMASKQIQSILAKLNITPQERSRKSKEEKTEAFDLPKYLEDES